MNTDNKVEINLPSSPCGDLPNPSAPVLKINGVEIGNIIAISIRAGVNTLTRVNVAFYASVEGIVTVDESELHKAEG